MLLEVLIYSGILGLILYIIFLYKTFFAAINLYKFDSNILGVVLIPVALTFIFALQGMSEKICWLIFAYIISKSIFYAKQKSIMNILIILDSLGSGGAQRQKTQLAYGLAKKFYNVSIFTYHKTENFFDHTLKKVQI